ncbi:MAG: EAL domain-containing protein [Glaciecola sp.]
MQAKLKLNVLFIGVTLVSLIIMTTVYVEILTHRSQSEHERAMVTQQLSIVHGALESKIYQNIELATGLASYLSFNPEVSASDFAKFSANIASDKTDIISLGLARNFVITHIYPLEGNEKVLGVDYRELPEQFEIVNKTVTLKKKIIAGPVDLVQGGVGLIARLPIAHENGSVDIISVVLDYNKIMSSVMSKSSTDLSISIRGADATGDQGPVFYGSERIFSLDPIKQTVHLPYGSWSMAAIPKQGWGAFTFNLYAWLISGIFIVLIIFTSHLYLKNTHLSRKKNLHLAFTQAKFKAFFDQNNVVMMMLDSDGSIHDSNLAAQNFYGYLQEELTHLSIIEPAARESDVDQAYTSVIKTKHVLANGNIRDVEVYKTPVELGDHEFVFAIVFDVTRQLRNEQNRRLFEAVYKHCQEGILVADNKHRIISVNPAFETITGYSESEALGNTPAMLKSGQHEAGFYLKMFKSIKTDGYWRGEIWNKTKLGKLYPQNLSISAVKDDKAEISNFVAVFSDISQQKESEKKLELLAHYDELTGLPNRLTLKLQIDQQLKIAQRKHSSCALLFVDLDRFKLINDSLGHAAGDDLLIKVGQRIKKRIREEDILARLGGDEFVIMVSDYESKDDLMVVAYDVCKHLKYPFTVAGVEVNIGASIGIAQYPDDANSTDELIKLADASMYKAKQNSQQDFVFYDRSITEEASTRLTIRAEINQAIANQEFELLLQPQINLESMTVCGAEALIRWNHPQKGLLTPDRFIQLAEDTGTINLITHWVVSSAFDIMHNWRQQHHNLRLSVNVSARELRQDSLYEHLHQLTEHYPGMAQYISLEIVESALVEELEETNHKLQGLRNLGFQIEIDDFGTGFSSLSYLGTLSVDALKIDRIFVQNMDSKVQSSIVKSIIALANNFDLSVISEGIETQQHAEMLIKLGCKVGQGYFFSKPIKQADFAERYLNT